MPRLALCVAWIALAGAADGPISLSIERAAGEKWNAVDSAIVFQGGDEVRFRFRSTEAGYLYILNESARGERSWIYPRPDDPAGNRIEADRDYIIPPGDAAFRVADEPGYDSLYYILTSVRLPGLPSAMPPVERPPARNTLIPRCSEGTLRARGLCMDNSAGARPVQDARRIETIQRLMRPDATARTGRGESGKLYIYELRLAHR